MAQFYYGGQAVMEGVMMRGQQSMVVAVRAPDGTILCKEEPLRGAVYGSRIRHIPLVRGVALLWETLALGIRALMWSANVALASEGMELTTPVMTGTLLVSLALGVGLFFVAPVVVVGLADRLIPSSLMSNLVEGVVRLGLFIGYLVLMGRMPDITRVFMYHGAEHKTINAYEAGVPLVPDHVQRFSTAHPRCGTTFLFEVLALSIIVFALLGRPAMEWRILSRIILIPLIASVAYEILRLGASAYGRRSVRVLLAPFLALQSLTTREPDMAQIEVAIAALARVLARDGIAANVWADVTPSYPVDASTIPTR